MGCSKKFFFNFLFQNGRLKKTEILKIANSFGKNLMDWSLG